MQQLGWGRCQDHCMSIGFFLNSNLSYIKLLITLKPTKPDWDSTVVHVSHMPYAADRPHPENGDYVGKSVSLLVHSWALLSCLAEASSYSSKSCQLPGMDNYRDIACPLGKGSCTMPTHA